MQLNAPISPLYIRGADGIGDGMGDGVGAKAHRRKIHHTWRHAFPGNSMDMKNEKVDPVHGKGKGGREGALQVGKSCRMMMLKSMLDGDILIIDRCRVTEKGLRYHRHTADIPQIYHRYTTDIPQIYRDGDDVSQSDLPNPHTLSESEKKPTDYQILDIIILGAPIKIMNGHTSPYHLLPSPPITAPTLSRSASESRLPSSPCCQRTCPRSPRLL